jgi:hypothetical protein
MRLSAPPLIFLIVLTAGFVLLILAIARGARAARPPWRTAARMCREPGCRAANVLDARFCARCGRKLD